MTRDMWHDVVHEHRKFQNALLMKQDPHYSNVDQKSNLFYGIDLFELLGCTSYKIRAGVILNNKTSHQQDYV